MFFRNMWRFLLVSPTLFVAIQLAHSESIAIEHPIDSVSTQTNSSEVLIEQIERYSFDHNNLVNQADSPVLLLDIQPVDREDQAADPAETTIDLQNNPETTETTRIAQTNSSEGLIEQIEQYNPDSDNALEQVTSVTQFSDVQPTDWVYQALQSLAEKYGCIVGYPDGTYRGQSALTRYEFAAGLNACLDRISELIAASTADLATQEDLATLQRLQEEFAAELATLRGRVDNLEARTAELEENQFSTTTKLYGETIFSVAAPLDEDDAFDDQTIGTYRVRLNFDTSFTGEDLLRARLEAADVSDFSAFAGNTSWQWISRSTNGDVVLDDLLYTFPVGDRLQIIIGAEGLSTFDFVAATISPFDSSGQGSLTYGLGTPPQYNYSPFFGTGVGAVVQLTDNLSFDFGYEAETASDPSPGNGLFNGDYGAIAQLTFLSDFADVALTYINSYAQNGFGSASGYLLGDYVSAFGADEPEIANIYGFQANFKPATFIQIGGGVMYMPVRVLDGDDQGDYQVWSYHGTVAFPDLGGEGNLLGLLFGVPPRIAGMSSSLYGDLDLGAGATRQDAAFLAEVFYRFQLNENISITPGLIYLADPGNNNDREDSLVGAIRTTFSF